MSDRLLDDVAALPPPAAPPLGAALEAELAGLAPVPTRRPARQLAILVGISLIYGAGLVVVLSTRRDMLDLPMGWLAVAGAAWLGGFLVPAYVALVPRRGSMMPRWPVLAVAAIASSIGFVLLGALVHPSGEHSRQLNWEHFPQGHGCLELGLLTALVPVTIGAIFLRGVLPVGARWVAAGLGAGGGCLGGLVLHLHCPITDGPHVALMHAGAVGVAALLSAALVPRATRR
jgi:hypothetical protein|nr:NrsF family protein [Kofleriaceae bacterium]